MALTDLPPLFQRIPSALFGPLAAGLSAVYWEILARFYQLEFEREPFFLVKPVDNLLKWRGESLHRLETIERDLVSLETAACWYAEQLGIDRESAARKVVDALHLLRKQFETLPQLIDDIDARNARFSGVALRKIMYLLRQDKRIEGQLQLAIDIAATDCTEVREGLQ